MYELQSSRLSITSQSSIGNSFVSRTNRSSATRSRIDRIDRRQQFSRSRSRNDRKPQRCSSLLLSPLSHRPSSSVSSTGSLLHSSRCCHCSVDVRLEERSMYLSPSMIWFWSPVANDAAEPWRRKRLIPSSCKKKNTPSNLSRWLIVGIPHRVNNTSIMPNINCWWKFPWKVSIWLKVNLDQRRSTSPPMSL